jgi:outer membrane lipoprotein-sorting protein
MLACAIIRFGINPMKKPVFILFLALFCAGSPVLASPPAAPGAAKIAEPTLSPQDINDIHRIEDYLNGLRSISADFMQIDEQGGIMRGKIAIQRPGKMRVTYDPPSKDFIVADGDWVHIWNEDLKSQTNVEQGSSLAEFVLRDPIKLSGDVTITRFQRFPAKLEVTLEQTGDPAAGSLTLVFEDHPLLLRQWKVHDPQGQTTGVSLENEQSGVSFPESTFLFVPPNFGKNSRSEIN